MMYIHGIALKIAKKQPMHMVPSAEITLEEGLIGDANRDKDRQVTLLSLNAWHTVQSELGVHRALLPWTMRRANICLTEYLFTKQDLGRRVRLGSSVILEITGETKPCRLMDMLHPGLRKALEPNFNAGVTSKVIHGGSISIEDEVCWL